MDDTRRSKSQSEYMALHIDTKAEIENFLDAMQAVPYDMIVKYISERVPESQIIYVLDQMKNQRKIFWDFKGRMVYLRSYNARYKSPKQKELQDNVIRAGWVVSELGADRILYLHRSVYPVQIMFATASNFSADVTVIDPNNISMLQTLLPRHWGSLLPEDVEDTCKHIALIPYSENWDGYDTFISHVKRIGFSIIAKTDPETKRVVFETVESSAAAKDSENIPLTQALAETKKALDAANKKCHRLQKELDAANRKNFDLATKLARQVGRP